MMKLNSMAKYSIVLLMTLPRNFLDYLYQTQKREDFRSQARNTREVVKQGID